MAKRTEKIVDRHEKQSIEDFNSLKNSYETHIRPNFVAALRNLCCKSENNFNCIQSQHNANCNPLNNCKKKISRKQDNEILINANNLLKWMDAKLNHIPNVSTNSRLGNQRKIKTCYFQNGQEKTKVCLHYKLPCFGSDSTAQNGQLKSIPSNEEYDNSSELSCIEVSTSKLDPGNMIENNVGTFHSTNLSNNILGESVNNLSEISNMVSLNSDLNKSFENDDKPVTDMVDNNKNKMIATTSSMVSSDNGVGNCSNNDTDKVIDEVNNIVVENEMIPTTSNLVSSDNNVGYCSNNNTDKITDEVNFIGFDIEGNSEHTNMELTNIDSNSNLKTKYKRKRNTSDSFVSLVVTKTNNDLKKKDPESESQEKNTALSKHVRLRSGKRSVNNSVTDSVCTSKKRKIEKLSLNHSVANTSSNEMVDAKKNGSPKAVVDQLMTSPLNIEEKVDLAKKSDDQSNIFFKNMNSRNSKGETKMHSFCAKGKLGLVSTMLHKGFNPNVKDNAGWTPMHEAVKSGNLDIVKKLIEFGAFVNVPGYEYETPLHTAMKFNQFEIASLLIQNGADIKCLNMYGDMAQNVNAAKWSELFERPMSSTCSKIEHTKTYQPDQIVVFLNNISLNLDIVNQFCKQFNIKLVKNMWKENQITNVTNVTHIIVPKTENNTCGVNLECLTGIANGLCLVSENWVSDSLKQGKLLKYENYEVSGTTSIVDCNGPKISRINKQKLYPKLFDGIDIHICGNSGWQEFSLENLKKLVTEFGAKLIKRMPNPEDCSTNIMPYHSRSSKHMDHVSTIILYTKESNRLIKYNMKHIKAFHISWFMEAAQKFIIE